MILAKIPGVARDYLRNVGTREMNYGIIRAPVTRDSVSCGEEKMSCPCWESNPGRPASSYID
jgi:hypothetical protein